MNDVWRNDMDWNRKDCEPETTIGRIKGILYNIGLEENWVTKNNYKDLWFSNRLEIAGLPGIGANGKGISEAYAQASAYAELIERLQSGMLLGDLFPRKQQIRNFNQNMDDFRKGMYNMYEESFSLSKEELRSVVPFYFGLLKTDVYYNAYTNRTDELPERIIRIVSGTNGLAAGNTYYEAFCQGCCEAFERYVIRKIYFDDQKIPNFPHEWVRQTKSYRLIQEIEKKDIRYILKIVLWEVLYQ